jgi:hypothetical protein
MHSPEYQKAIINVFEYNRRVGMDEFADLEFDDLEFADLELDDLDDVPAALWEKIETMIALESPAPAAEIPPVKTALFMDGFDKIKRIPENEWKKLTGDQQDAFNRRIRVDKEYARSLNDTPPAALFVVGCILGVFGLRGITFFTMTFGALGGILCIFATLWEIIRVIDRPHRYQRVRDASDEFKRVMNLK